MKKSFFVTLLSIVFLDLLGVTIIIPILAPLFIDANGIMASSPLAIQTFTLGLLLACFPIAQFFGAPILGALSDRHGRKPILAISLIGTFIGYVIFAFGIIFGQIWMLFAGRILDGFTGGNIAIVMSAVADVSSKKDKAANFGLIGMAFGFGFIIGPFIGGVLSDPKIVSWFTFATPFWASAGLSLLSLFLVLKVFKETCKERRKTPVSMLTGFKNLKVAFALQNLRLIFLVVFLQGFAFTFFTQFSQVFYIQKFAFTPADIGYLFGFTGLWIALTQGLLVRIATKWYTSKQMVLVALPLLGISFFIILLAPTVSVLYLGMMLLAIFAGFVHPTLNAIVSDQAGSESQGEIMGLNQSINSAAQAAPAIIAGIIVTIHMNLPIIAAGVTMLIAWFAFLYFLKQPKETFHEV